jgi:hypothetical protein
MCLWEAYLDDTVSADAKAGLDALRAAVGTAQLRLNFITLLVEPCEAAYLAATADGYDDCFDWDFVPQWLSDNWGLLK